MVPGGRPSPGQATDPQLYCPHDEELETSLLTRARVRLDGLARSLQFRTTALTFGRSDSLDVIHAYPSVMTLDTWQLAW
jgi:hypothetical protein